MYANKNLKNYGPEDENNDNLDRRTCFFKLKVMNSDFLVCVFSNIK